MPTRSLLRPSKPPARRAPQAEPAAAPSWPEVLPKLLRPLKHYVGVALVIIATALASTIAYLIMHAREVSVGSVRVTRIL